MKLFAHLLFLSSLVLTGLLSFPARGELRYANCGWTVRIDSFIDLTAQQALKLQSMSKPGYFSYQIVFNTHLQPSCNSSLCETTSTVMPVHLIDFSGKRLDARQVQLGWITSAEINNDHFDVQRSLNPANGFEGVGSVKGQGNSSDNVTYQFFDPNAETGYTYYRLKQVNADGSFRYSQIIAIKGYQEVLTVQAIPNPSPRHQLDLKVSGVQGGESVSIGVYDRRGAVVYQNLAYTLSADQRISLPGLSLLAGSYYVRIKTSQQQAVSAFIVLP